MSRYFVETNESVINASREGEVNQTRRITRALVLTIVSLSLNNHELGANAEESAYIHACSNEVKMLTPDTAEIAAVEGRSRQRRC